MTDSALASYFRAITSPRELRRHIRDAAIAMQLCEPTRAQWLAKCERVRRARSLASVPAERVGG